MLTPEITVLDPRTGETVGRVPIATAAGAASDALGRARAAADGWARDCPPPSARPRCTPPRRPCRDAADELAALNERETGKPFDDARGGVDAGDRARWSSTPSSGPCTAAARLHGSWDATDLMVPGPRGVVAVLTPWNDPVAVAAGLLGAALVTGNTVVHKPSERCPLTGRRFAELLAAHLPEGVLEILDGDGSVGCAARRGGRRRRRARRQLRHRPGDRAGVRPHRREGGAGERRQRPADRRRGRRPGLGRRAGRARAPSRTPGRSASRSSASTATPRSPTRSSPRSSTEARAWQERLGPLVDRRHRDHVHGQVAEALAAGARALTGGAVPDGPGAFYPPTVLIGCTPEMRVMREETFGPVAPVRVVPDFDAALAEAIDDDYGLAATVLTADMGHAQAAWRALPVGTVKVNDVFGGAPGGAAQPRRGSGTGFGYGPELLDEMTTTKVVHISPPPT